MRQQAANHAGTASQRGWSAALDLRYHRLAGRTVVTRAHDGPLVVQRSLHPEGPSLCQSIIVHPPGGIVGGDRLEIGVDAQAGASAQLTTPGATKWYRSAGPWAEQSVAIRIAHGAAVEWLPQESIVYDAAHVRQRVAIEVAAGGKYIGWDLFCLGRTAAGEGFGRGRLAQESTVAVDGELRWVERARVDGNGRAWRSPIGLNGQPVFGTLLAYAAALPDGLLTQCRAIAPADGEGVVTALPGLLVARYRGRGVEPARRWFVDLWTCLRPALLGRAAVLPRIWRT